MVPHVLHALAIVLNAMLRVQASVTWDTAKSDFVTRRPTIRARHVLLAVSTVTSMAPASVIQAAVNPISAMKPAVPHVQLAPRTVPIAT